MRVQKAAAAILLFSLILAAGCTVGPHAAGSPPPGARGATGGTLNSPADLRYVLSPPRYVSPGWFLEREWTANVTIINAGDVAADGYCLRALLINNRTGDIVAARYVQYACRGCITPGTVRNDTAVFSPGWQAEGTYRVAAQSCGMGWDPVRPVSR